MKKFEEEKKAKETKVLSDRELQRQGVAIGVRKRPASNSAQLIKSSKKSKLDSVREELQRKAAIERKLGN